MVIWGTTSGARDGCERRDTSVLNGLGDAEPGWHQKALIIIRSMCLSTHLGAKLAVDREQPWQDLL
jgi:hypothetical protein